MNAVEDGNSAESMAGVASKRQDIGKFIPLFRADWERVLMIHLEVDPQPLQRTVPFALDLWDGRAFVTLVAFTMRGLRFRAGGPLGAWLLRPIAEHEFLNVRTYVRHDAGPGIHFLAEWLSNRWAVPLGPLTFSLPYHFGRIEYRPDLETGELRGRVEDVRSGTTLAYEAGIDLRPAFVECSPGSLTEWLMERYLAFNSDGHRARVFQVAHPPWRQVSGQAELLNDSLVTSRWPWLRGARAIGVNYSPGVRQVQMSWPVRLKPQACECGARLDGWSGAIHLPSGP